MNTIDIPERNINLSIPSHWDEINPSAQYEGYSKSRVSVMRKNVYYCLKQALKASNGNQSILSTQIKCFYRLADIKLSWKTIMMEKIMPAEWIDLKNSNAAQTAQQLITFLFKPAETESSAEPGAELSSSGADVSYQSGAEVSSVPLELNYNTILNHFQSIKIPNTCVYGPGHLLTDLSFGEFRAAIEELDEYFFMSSEDGNSPKEAHHQLSRFITCLYRPERRHYKKMSKREDYDGTRREPFNRNLIQKNAYLIDDMDQVYRTAVLLWFTYCVNYIQTEELTISGRTITLRQLFPKSNGQKPRAKSQRNGSSWTPILYSIAKEGIFGNAEATDKVGLFDILIYMYDEHQAALKAKLKTKK